MDTMLQYKCPCCGGAIDFNSTTQTMKCPYCDTEFDVETLKQYDEDLKSQGEDKLDWNKEREQNPNAENSEMTVYVCQSCGGEIATSETLAATKCPFCDNPVVLKGKLAGDLMPDYVIPFKLDKKAAKEKFFEHLKNKPLLPKAFKSDNHIDEIKGIYVPFWLYDAKADANIRYKATKLRMWSDKNYDYTETSHYSVVRAGNIAFEHVPVDGSVQMPNDLMETIEPFDFSEAVDFQTAYLAGYLADKYDVDSTESEPRANERIKCSTEAAFAQTVVGYDTVIPESTSVQLNDSSIKYAFYPVWILNTTWKGESSCLQ